MTRTTNFTAHLRRYVNVGLDDGWQSCGAGWNGSFHTKAGEPIIDKAKFPDMKAMVDKAHSLSLRAGWYMCVSANQPSYHPCGRQRLITSIARR